MLAGTKRHGNDETKQQAIPDKQNNAKRRKTATRSRKGKSDEDLSKKVLTTVTTSLGSTASSLYVRLLRDVVHRTSKIIILANLVGTSAVLDLLQDRSRHIPSCVFDQTFFNRCAQLCSTLKGKHSLLVARRGDSLEELRVKEALNRAWLKLHRAPYSSMTIEKLPDRGGLTQVISYESRKLLTNLRMHYSFDTLKTKQRKSVRIFLLRAASTPGAPMLPFKQKKKTKIMQKLVTLICHAIRWVPTERTLENFASLFEESQLPTERGWWFCKLVTHLRRHWSALPYPLFLADSHVFQHTFVHYSAMLTRTQRRGAPILPQVSLSRVL